MSARRDAVVAVAANRDLRGLLGAWSLWRSADWGQQVALATFAFAEGGASAVAVFGVVRTVAAAAVAPFVGVVGDRAPRAFVLAGAAALSALATAGAAVAVWAGAAMALAYALSAVSAVATAAYRPVANAFVPTLVRTPAEVVATNLVGTLVEGTSTFAGPLAAGLLLGITAAGPVLVGCAAVTAAAAALLARLPVVPVGPAVPVGPVGPLRSMVPVGPAAADTATTVARDDGADRPRPLRDVAAGFRAIVGEPDRALLCGLTSAQTLVRGALNVLVVVVAVDRLGTGDRGVGVLLGAIGVGGLVGFLVTIRLVGRAHLAVAFGVGLTLWGLPIAAVAFVDDPVAAAAVFAVIGIGNNLVDVSVFSLLQRLAPNAVLARLMGSLEATLQATVALGSVLAAALLAAFGARATLVAVGLFLPAVALACAPRLARIDTRTSVHDDDIALLRGLDLFAPLPMATIGDVATRLDRIEQPAGVALVTEGEPGDRYYVIEDGEVEVRAAARTVRLGRGEAFGEIALLRAVPRTATVCSVTPVVVRSLGRDDFLGVVTGSEACGTRADAIVATHLAADASAGALTDRPRAPR